MKKKSKNNIKLLYIGKRRSYSGKSAECFLINGKEEINFSGVKGLVLGYYYFANKDKGDITISARPERAEFAENIDQKVLDVYEAKHRAAIEANQERLENKKNENRMKELAKSKSIQGAIDILRPIVKKLNYLEYDQFISSLVRECLRGRK